MKKDLRNIVNGSVIYNDGYCDQPYVIKTDDGAWLCVMTVGAGIEGEKGQHLISCRSRDCGNSWEDFNKLESDESFESSYAVLAKMPFGRIYAFYNYNGDNIREVKREDAGTYDRVDSLGQYVFKYSDDNGMTWSDKRYVIDVREFECDRNNIYRGRIRFFWNVGRPLIADDSLIWPLHKVGSMGEGFFAQSEGAFLLSRNILTEKDPAKIIIETFPDGDVGLKTPKAGGRIAEEHSITRLSDGSLYCVYRTVDGWPACAYSRDSGHSWSEPQYKQYSDGRRIKNPRAANFVWRCSNGKFLYWYHNHGGQRVFNRPQGWLPDMAYDDRNPVWLCAGVEYDTPEGKCIKWSHPEIILYHDDPFVRMSYPDLIEENGKIFITETQKTIARVHQIDQKLIDALFNQFQAKGIARDGLVFEVSAPIPLEIKMPHFSQFHVRNDNENDGSGLDLRVGFSIDMWLNFISTDGRKIIFDSRDSAGQGVCVYLNEQGNIAISINDGTSESQWNTYPVKLQKDKLHHVVIIVDGGPKVISFVVDGIFCDGGNERQFGWGHFSPLIKNINGAKLVKLSSDIKSLRIYNRYLLTSEAISNYMDGMK